MTEEVWSWWREGSVHRAAWPSTGEFEGLSGDPEVLSMASDVLTAVRRAKSDAKTSMRTEVTQFLVTGGVEQRNRLKQAESDLLEASRAKSIEYRDGVFEVEVSLDID